MIEANKPDGPEIQRRPPAGEIQKPGDERFRQLVDAIPDYAIFMLDPKGFVSSWNVGAENIKGYCADDVIGRHFSLFYPPEDVQNGKPDRELETATREGRCEDEGWRVRKDGSRFWANVIIAPLKDRSGQLWGFAKVTRDLSERKRMEESLRAAEHRFRTMAQTMPASVAIYQGTGHAYVNAAAETMLGYTREELLHRSFMDYVHPDSREMVLQRSLARQRGEMVTSRYEIKLQNKDGREVWVDFAAAPIEYEGKPAVLGISVDITQRKELEAIQLKAREAAEAASRAKSTFLANMSHEIRTPMNAVIGMTELLLGTELKPLQREYLGIVKDSAESLLALINDILDFSKIEAGKLELDASAFQLREVLGDTMKGLALRARGKDVEVACHFHPNVPEIVVGDSLRLRQVVSNLVGNAIKFTQRGEVVLDVAEESANDGDACLHFTVRDTGIGIPLEKQQSIFDAFSQADPSTTRQFGGTGLGLAISARLVSLMGGEIWVESEVGRGSKFHFTVQLKRETRVPRVPRSSIESLIGLRVLVVDDNETNRLILREMLANWEMHPTTVADADGAIQELRRAEQAGSPHHLVLTDVHMPGVDGFQLTERIRGSDYLDGTVILMLTSGDGPGDIERCRKVGGSAHLMKPVKQSELFDAIVTSLGMTRHAEPPAGEPVATPVETRPLRILLAEDSYPNQRLAVGVLSKWGHHVTVANNGLQAVAALDSGSFDLVLMDVQMPEMDGYQATAVIREREARLGGHIPIVAMTAHAMKGDREECLAAGMDGYVSKPIRKAELERVIAEVTSERSPQRTEIASDVSSAPARLTSQNWEHAFQTADGDSELLEQVLVSILDECPVLMTQMAQALRDADVNALHRAAHTFKGNARIFGQTSATELAEQLESLKKNGDCAGGSELFQRLCGEANAFLNEVREYLREHPNR
jgi:two-component system, sensor histidine kinase and response regulator